MQPNSPKSRRKSNFSTAKADILPIALILFLLFADKDENIKYLSKKIITDAGLVNTAIDSNIDLNAKKNPIKLRHPFHLPELKEANVKGKDLTVNLHMSDLQVIQVGSFNTTEKRENTSIAVNLDIDNVTLFVMYTIDGSIYKEHFSHVGKAEVMLTDVVTSALIQHVVDVSTGIVEIANIDLNIDFKTLEFGQTGLWIKKLPPSEQRRILNSMGKIYLKQNLNIVTNRLSDLITSQMNTILKNRNRDQIAKLLRSYTHIHRSSSNTKESNIDLRSSAANINNTSSNANPHDDSTINTDTPDDAKENPKNDVDPSA